MLMGVYSIDDQKNGRERPTRRKKKSLGEGGKHHDPRYHTPQGKPQRGAAPSKKAIDMSIGPKWEAIEGVRTKTRAFLKNQGLSKELIDALTMVCSELVENGMKYGYFERPESRLKLKLHILEKNVIAEVTHPTSANAAQHLRRLDKTIQWIRGYQDPFQAYIEKLKEVARRPINDSESGLGLVRIAYEGKSILDFFVAEDNALNVSAIAGVEKGLRR
jgi:hypothetical protein